jgi:hypothetical protein
MVTLGYRLLSQFYISAEKVIGMVFSDETFLHCVNEDDNGEKMRISMPLGSHMVGAHVQLYSHNLNTTQR